MLSYKMSHEDMSIIAVSRTVIIRDEGEKETENKFIYYSPDHDGEVQLSHLTETQLSLYKSLGKYVRELKKHVVIFPKCGNDSVLVPLLIRSKRTVYYIAGQSGAGKSFLAKMITEYMSAIGPCYLITTVPDSSYNATLLDVTKLVEKNTNGDLAAYNRAKIVYRNKKKHLTDDQKIEMELMIEDLKPKTVKDEYRLTDDYRRIIEETATMTPDSEKRSLFIYDDTEVHPDAAKLKFIQDTQLVNGRHDNISMCILNHLTNSGIKTKLQISESHVFCIFKPLNKYVIYFLTMYMSFSDEMVASVRAMLSMSRYVCVYPEFKLILCEYLMFKYE